MPRRARLANLRQEKVVLKETAGKDHKSAAHNASADCYLKMARDTTAMAVGAIKELTKLAVMEGSVTPKEIAYVLDTEKLPVEVGIGVHH